MSFTLTYLRLNRAIVKALVGKFNRLKKATRLVGEVSKNDWLERSEGHSAVERPTRP